MERRVEDMRRREYRERLQAQYRAPRDTDPWDDPEIAKMEAHERRRES